MAKSNKCLINNLSVSYSLKRFCCKCFNCREYKRKSTKKYRIKNNLRHKNWCENNKEYVKKYRLKTKERDNKRNKQYRLRMKGITQQEYDLKLISQNNLCLICKLPQPNKKPLFIDHNHKTGEIRGLLCVRCNSGLGHFKDDIFLLERAIEYIKKNGDIS